MHGHPGRTRGPGEGEHVVDQGPAVGFATTVPAGPDLELEDLFTDPDHVRRGVGRALVDDVLAFAGTTGAARVTVDANPHAQAFYGSVGFVVDGEAPTELGTGLRMHRDV